MSPSLQANNFVAKRFYKDEHQLYTLEGTADSISGEYSRTWFTPSPSAYFRLLLREHTDEDKVRSSDLNHCTTKPHFTLDDVSRYFAKYPATPRRLPSGNTTRELVS